MPPYLSPWLQNGAGRSKLRVTVMIGNANQFQLGISMSGRDSGTHSLQIGEMLSNLNPNAPQMEISLTFIRRYSSKLPRLMAAEMGLPFSSLMLTLMNGEDYFPKCCAQIQPRFSAILVFHFFSNSSRFSASTMHRSTYPPWDDRNELEGRRDEFKCVIRNGVVSKGIIFEFTGVLAEWWANNFCYKRC